MVGRIEVAWAVLEAVRPLDGTEFVLRSLPEVSPGSEGGMQRLQAGEYPLNLWCRA